jgi:hypothetical protein
MINHGFCRATEGSIGQAPRLPTGDTTTPKSHTKPQGQTSMYKHELRSKHRHSSSYLHSPSLAQCALPVFLFLVHALPQLREPFLVARKRRTRCQCMRRTDAPRIRNQGIASFIVSSYESRMSWSPSRVCAFFCRSYSYCKTPQSRRISFCFI